MEKGLEVALMGKVAGVGGAKLRNAVQLVDGEIQENVFLAEYCK